MAPDLVLLDFNYPNFQEFELIRKIKSHVSEIDFPIIVLSLSSGKTDVVQSLINSANAFLTKPIDYSAFADAIYRIWEYWFSNN